jgi:hypothetical protein
MWGFAFGDICIPSDSNRIKSLLAIRKSQYDVLMVYTME